MQFLHLIQTLRERSYFKMARVKRVREPGEVLEPTIKHQRVQKPRNPGPTPQQNPRTEGQDESGRHGPSSHRAPLAGAHHSPSVQPPPEQPEQRPRRLKLNPPKPQSSPDPRPAQPTTPGSSASETSTCYSQAVGKYDVARGVEAVGTPTVEDYEYWGRTDGAAEFIRSRSGLEENWIGVRPVGKGSYGIAGLWELRGDDGDVVKVSIQSRQLGIMMSTDDHVRKWLSKRKLTRERSGGIKNLRDKCPER